MASGQMKSPVWSIALILLLAVAAVAHGGERMAVAADIANIRSGPSVGDALLWQVEQYHPLVIVEKRGSWYRFKDFEGDEGWISAALLDSTPTVIVNVSRCNVRTGPGTDNPVAFIADRGIPFKVLQTKGQWIEVEHADGDRGWVLNTLVW